ncbi:MAG: hypothetical protein IK093_06000 [Ruminiclostridium sp.]|nr:hypothetical protein [Ruminiclostridium sp.]
MRNDIQKIKTVTNQMKINDLLYEAMRKEYDGLVKKACEAYNEYFSEEVEKLYFPRRVLSLLSNQDLPMRCAVGLYSIDGVLIKIASVKEKYIGDSDSDVDIMTLLLELGYKAYAKAKSGATIEQVFENIIRDKNGD